MKSTSHRLLGLVVAAALLALLLLATQAGSSSGAEAGMFFHERMLVKVLRRLFRATESIVCRLAGCRAPKDRWLESPEYQLRILGFSSSAI